MQYKKVAPVGDRVFVKIDKEEDKTTSGILLPSSAQKKPTQGEIVDIGDAKALKVRDLQLNLAAVFPIRSVFLQHIATCISTVAVFGKMLDRYSYVACNVTPLGNVGRRQGRLFKVCWNRDYSRGE